MLIFSQHYISKYHTVLGHTYDYSEQEQVEHKFQTDAWALQTDTWRFLSEQTIDNVDV